MPVCWTFMVIVNCQGPEPRMVHEGGRQEILIRQGAKACLDSQPVGLRLLFLGSHRQTTAEEKDQE